MAARRSGAPWWSFATRTSVRWPTTSRPRRIQPRRRSSSRSPAPSSRAARSGAGTPAGSRTRRSAPARRANATRRPSWSAGRGGRVGGEPPRRPAGAVFLAGAAGFVAERRRLVGPVPRPREVENEEVHRPRLEERPRHREPFVEGVRDEDREPLQAHAAGNRLHGIQAPGEVHPGDEGAAGLGLRDRPQGEGRRAAGSTSPEDDRPGPRQAAGREQRVKLRKAGGDAPVDAPFRLAGELPGRGRGCRVGAAGQGHQCRTGRAGRLPGSAPRPPSEGAETTSGSAGAAPASAGNGAAASAPKTSTAGRGAAAPQRARRLARAAARSAW